MWVAAGIVPFLPFDVATKGAIIAGDLIAAEVVGLLGILLIGKEAYQSLKGRMMRWRSKKE